MDWLGKAGGFTGSREPGHKHDPPAASESTTFRLERDMQNESPRRSEGRISRLSAYRCERLVLRRLGRVGGCGRILGVLAAEALHATGGIHELLLAGEEGMAGGADFYADVALMGGAGNKRRCRTRNARALRYKRDEWLLSWLQTSIRVLRFYRKGAGFSKRERLSVMS
jgi:hypothetical protein